jgi:hypothetical protein
VVSHAVTLDRGLLYSAYIPPLPSACTNDSVHFSYPSFNKHNFCLRMRGRLHNRDYSRLAGELQLTRGYHVPTYCEMSGCRPLTFADTSQAQEISRDLLPAGSHHDSMQHLYPIATAYQESSYDGMRTAIFPGYFHGKCQRNGANPPGCPNPDCPVVCGTPGSLVHFFPTLRFIAFNYTRSMLQWLCSPGNDAYERTERSVVQAAAGPRERRRVPWFEYAITRGRGKLAQGLYARKREEDVKKRLGEIMSQAPDLLEEECGGYPSEDENALPKCSWESMMKTYILTYP